MNWILTIPKTIPWSHYQKELNAVANGRSIMNYKTRYFPKEMKNGDRCYLVHEGLLEAGWSLLG